MSDYVPDPYDKMMYEKEQRIAELVALGAELRMRLDLSNQTICNAVYKCREGMFMQDCPVHGREAESVGPFKTPQQMFEDDMRGFVANPFSEQK